MSKFSDDIYENIIQLPKPLIKIILIYTGDGINMSDKVSYNDIYNIKSWEVWHARRNWLWPKYGNSDIPSLGELKNHQVLDIYNKIYLK